MIPELHFFSLTFNWYWVFNFIGIPLALTLLYPKLKKDILDRQMLNQLIFMLITGGYIFAKIFSTIEFYIINDKHIDLEVFSFILNNSGMKWYGALLGNLLLLIILMYKNPKFLSIITSIIIYISLGAFIGKLGCLVSGHGCYGIATNLPWGQMFSHGSSPSIFPVHPTPAYDSLVFLTAFIIGFYMRKRLFPDDVILVVITVLICITEFFIEFIRPNPEIFLGINFGQICYVTFLLTIMCILIHKRYLFASNN